MAVTLDPYIPELGQAAFGGPWQEYAMPGYIQSGLARLGEAVTPESSTGADPTINSGASFENAVFALRAYCWCDGEEHGEGCPPNFEHKASGFAASWYKYLGRGGSVNRRIGRAAFERMIAECLASVPGSGVAGQRGELERSVKAALPEGTFVAVGVEGDLADLQVWLPWPAGVPAEVDPDPEAAVAPYAAAAGEAVAAALRSIGWSVEPVSDEPFFMTCPLPPSSLGDPGDEATGHCYRELSDDEPRAVGWENPDEAFWSERFMLVRYSGLNLFRSARRHGA